MQTFNELKDAIDEASWCANTYGDRHAIISYKNLYGVCELGEVKRHDYILEICYATETLRSRDFISSDERDEIGGIESSAYGTQG